MRWETHFWERSFLTVRRCGRAVITQSNKVWKLAELRLEMLNIIPLFIARATPYEAIQTPNAETLKKENKNLMTHYAELIIKRKNELSKMSKYIAVDAYFSKKAMLLRF